MPLLEETGHMPTEKYAHAPEILEHSQRVGKHFGLYDNVLFHTEVTDLEWDADQSRWIVRTNRGDEFTAQFVAMGLGPLHVPKLPGLTGIEDFRGSLLPHEPVGLRLHGRRPDGRADGPLGRQACRDHRDGGDCRAVRPASRQGVQGAVRVPAHAVVGGRPRQPSDRSRVVRDHRDARLAATLARQLHRHPDRDGDAGRRPRDGRLDRSRTPNAREDPVAAAGRDHAGERAGGVRGLRLREDERDPGSRRFDRRGPGDRAEPQGLVPAVVQAAVLPRRVPAGVQRAGHAPRRHERQRRRAHHRERRRGRGRRVRGRLHHLRVRLRGRHRLHASRRLRDDRSRRREVVGRVGRRDANQARHARPRIPQRIHRADLAGRQPGVERARTTSPRRARRSRRSCATRSTPVIARSR